MEPIGHYRQIRGIRRGISWMISRMTSKSTNTSSSGQSWPTLGHACVSWEEGRFKKWTDHPWPWFLVSFSISCRCQCITSGCERASTGQTILQSCSTRCIKCYGGWACAYFSFASLSMSSQFPSTQATCSQSMTTSSWLRTHSTSDCIWTICAHTAKWSNPRLLSIAQSAISVSSDSTITAHSLIIVWATEITSIFCRSFASIQFFC